MSLTAAAKNTMLDNGGITQLSLHTAYSASGANEHPTTGSPQYARKNVTFAAASAGSKATNNQPVFDVFTQTIRWVGKWIGSTFAGMSPNGGSEKEFFVDVTTNVVTCYAHQYANDTKVVFFGDTPPGGLTEGQEYFVISSTTDTFKVSDSSGGAEKDITSVPGPGCVVSKLVAQAYAGQGTHTITAGSISMNA